MIQKLKSIYWKFRMLWYRKLYKLENAHSTLVLGGKSSISSDIQVGVYVYIGPNCKIYSGVSIGDYTMLAHDVCIMGGDHAFDKPGVPIIFSGRGEKKRTIIGKDVWVGAYSKILTGVTIGDGAIIAMGSIVTKDVEPFSIYGGVPARKIKNRFKTEEETEIHKKMLKQNAIEILFNEKDMCGHIKV